MYINFKNLLPEVLPNKYINPGFKATVGESRRKLGVKIEQLVSGTALDSFCSSIRKQKCDRVQQKRNVSPTVKINMVAFVSLWSLDLLCFLVEDEQCGS